MCLLAFWNSVTIALKSILTDSTVYYYGFWYILLSCASSPATASSPEELPAASHCQLTTSFWLMLFVMNMHYILGSTGAYFDILSIIRSPIVCISQRTAMTAPVWWHSFRKSAASYIAPTTDTLAAYEYRYALAIQDFIADITCAVCVPTIITVFAWTSNALPVSSLLATTEHHSLETFGTVSSIVHVSSQRLGAPLGYIAVNQQQLWVRFGLYIAARVSSTIVSCSLMQRKQRQLQQQDSGLLLESVMNGRFVRFVRQHGPHGNAF